MAPGWEREVLRDRRFGLEHVQSGAGAECLVCRASMTASVSTMPPRLTLMSSCSRSHFCDRIAVDEMVGAT